MKFAWMWLVVLAGCSWGTVRIVALDGSGDYTSINTAIEESYDGDTILVQPGIYKEDIYYGGRAITVTGANPDDPNVILATILDGTIYLYLGEQENAIFQGMTVRGRSYPLNANLSTDLQFKVSGTRVVWVDSRNSDTTGKDIYGLDISTGKELVICTAAGDQVRPAIYGDIVVWEDYRAATTAADIYGLNLTTMEECVVSNGTQDESAPAIYDTTVVWQDNRSSATGYDIYSKNLTTGTETLVTATVNTYDQKFPSIYSTIVVWQDYRSGSSWDIYYRNLTSGSSILVSNATGNQMYPVVSQSYFVWQDYRSGNADIYAKNRSTSTEVVVCNKATEQANPQVEGSVVVWEDYRSGNYDIYSKDLSTSTETAICTDVNNQKRPCLSGSRFLWADYRWGDPLLVYIDQSRTATSSIICVNACPKIQNSMIETLDNGIVGSYGSAPTIFSNTILYANIGISGCSGTIQDTVIQLAGIGAYNCGGTIQNNVIAQNNTALESCSGTIVSNAISYNVVGVKSCSGIVSDNVVTASTSYGLQACKGILSDNQITANGGAGIYSGGDPNTVIADNVIYDNSVGITSATALEIKGNIVVGNAGDGIVSCTTPTIKNNVVSGNTGMGIKDCTGAVTNNTVVENTSSGIKSTKVVKNNIIAWNGGYGVEGGQISYNCFWRNTSGIYSGSVPGLGNISADPLFADQDNGDYHIKSESGRWDPNTSVWIVDTQTSRCVDGGDPADSTTQEPNPNGARINIGAYGGTSQASLSSGGNGTVVPVCSTKPTMDFTGDCIVNLADFALFAAQWLHCGLEPVEACTPSQ